MIEQPPKTAQGHEAAGARRSYRVAARTVQSDASAAAPEAPLAKPPAAVFVVHGMGQQVPFETLDQVAEGLRQVDERHRGGPSPQGIARSVQIGDERLQRLELRLQ